MNEPQSPRLFENFPRPFNELPLIKAYDSKAAEKKTTTFCRDPHRQKIRSGMKYQPIKSFQTQANFQFKSKSS
jgi:hypothetical protein